MRESAHKKREKLQKVTQKKKSYRIGRKKELLEVAKSGTKKEFLYTICAGGGTPRNFEKMRTKKELCNTITRRSRKP